MQAVYKQQGQLRKGRRPSNKVELDPTQGGRGVRVEGTRIGPELGRGGGKRARRRALSLTAPLPLSLLMGNLLVDLYKGASTG